MDRPAAGDEGLACAPLGCFPARRSSREHLEEGWVAQSDLAFWPGVGILAGGRGGYSVETGDGAIEHLHLVGYELAAGGPAPLRPPDHFAALRVRHASIRRTSSSLPPGREACEFLRLRAASSRHVAPLSASAAHGRPDREDGLRGGPAPGRQDHAGQADPGGVRDLESVRDLSSLELLADLLTDRVGSLLSVNSLREDLEVNHKAVSHWMDILERLYYAFRVRPFRTRAVRGLKKMPKTYLWDASLVADEGARFENLVALHLLKLCHFLDDHDGFSTALHFLRDEAGREVDFLVTCEGKPWFAVEAKLREERPSRQLRYFRTKLDIPYCHQVALHGRRDFVQDGIRCLPAARLLTALV